MKSEELDLVDQDEEDDDEDFGERITNSRQLEKYYSSGQRCIGAGYLRFILLFFVSFWNLGNPDPTGILTALSGFATPCFFILSGYFVLSGDSNVRKEKTGRKIKRALIGLGLMMVLYIILSVAVCYIQKITISISLRVVFNFLVLNLWPLPVGTNIWFIQAMLYAYIVIFIADKLKLMKFYKPVMVICFILMLLSGELAGLIHFNLLGYAYIPGNWLTRALPYILLGKLLREKKGKLLRIKFWKYLIVWLIGFALVIAEILALAKFGCLVYQGHMIGYAVMALAACGLALSKPTGRESTITYYDTAMSGIPYILMDPAYYALGLILSNQYGSLFSAFGGLAALAVSILLTLVFTHSRLTKHLFT